MYKIAASDAQLANCNLPPGGIVVIQYIHVLCDFQLYEYKQKLLIAYLTRRYNSIFNYILRIN